jgi:hypothetical protein
MSQALDLTLGRIDKVAQEIGLAELSRRSDVPVSTLHDWQKEDWRPRTIRALGKVSAAAEAHLNPEAEA